MQRGVFVACRTEKGEMEDYKEFVQYRLSQLRESEDNQPSKPARSYSVGPSLIRFHGRSILPPLLSGNQREEMQRHRDAALRTADQRKSKTDARVAYIQNILHSVQLRKAPTLEEFFHEETGFSTSKTSHSHSTSNVSMSQCADAIETKDSPTFSPPSGVMHDGKGGVSVPPLTSTLCGAFSAQHLTPDQSYQEGFSIDQYEDKLASQPITDPLADMSHQSLSSGYVTYENAENATSVSGRIEARGESLEFVFEEVADDTASFFIHNTSNTITKMPDIINHPPIDGEDLEKCEVAPFIYDHFKAGPGRKDICSASPQQDNVICPNSGELVNSCGDEATSPPIGESKTTHLGSTECEERFHSAQIKDSHGQEQNHPGNEGPVPSIEASCHSGNPDPLETLTTPQSSTSNQPEILNQARDMESVHDIGKADSAAPPEEPYRMSLQALLKKSQEYRRRQRLLRNQAKNARNQERTQREPLSKGEEESGLSDKENDEFPRTGRMTADGRKTKEKRVTIGTKIHLSLPVETSPEKAGGDEEKMSRSEGILVQEYHGEKANIESKDTYLTGDGNTDSEILTGVEEELASKDNQPNSSSGVRTESEQAVNFLKPLPVIPMDNSPVQEALFLTREQGTTCGPARPCSEGRRKFQTVPTPQFCMSPIHCKGGGVGDGVGIPKRKLLVNTPFNVDKKVVPEVKRGQENNQDTAVSPTVPQVGGSAKATALATSSVQAQQIDQLELNLSSLKALISDLESTLTENHSQDDLSNSPSDLCHKLIEHTDQTNEDQHNQVDQDDYGYWEDRHNGDDRNDTGLEQLDSEGQRRESLDDYNNMHGETGPEPSLNDPKDPTVLELERGNGKVNVGGVWLARTSAMETGGGGLTTLGVAPCKVQWSDRAPVTKDLDIMSYGRYEGCKQQPSIGCITSLAQKMRIPDVFRKFPNEVKIPHKGSVLSDTSNQPMERRIEITVEGDDSSHSMSLNQSYDVDTPSGVWLWEGSGSDLGSTGHDVQGKHLTPEYGGQGGASKAKRRLLMHATEGNEEGKWDRCVGDGSVVRPPSSTPKASSQRHGGVGGQEGKLRQQLKLAHAAEVRALREEQSRQQQELLQALAVRYRLLQSMSFPCPTSSSRLGDASTSPTLPSASEPSSSLPECYCPLVAAAAKGFLTRRLLKTARVAQLVRTIKDTQQFLRGFQPQTPGRGEFSGKQDLLLLERVTLQLRSARYEVYDIFFNVPTGERMQLISWDRDLVRERELRRQSGETGHSRGKNSLSAATQKSLERKRGVMILKKAAERQRVVGVRAGPRAGPRAGHECGPAAEEPKRGQFKANPRRVPKTTSSCRPR